MVDSISNLSARSLLQTQNQAQSQNSAGMVALKSSTRATQAIIDQLQQTVEQGKALMKQTAASGVAPSSNLPRGSLIDIVV